MRKQTFSDHVWSWVDVKGPDDCWPWRGVTNRTGYGWFRHRLKRWRSHRAAWTDCHGPIPEGMWVLHHCDNPRCCNPHHLYLGTVWENARDRVARDRGHHGSTSPIAKLDEAKVATIKRLRAKGISQDDVAWLFNVSPGTIQSIDDGESWRRVA